jgi:hypothetical protein
MKLTKEFLIENYKRFKEEIFNGKLPSYDGVLFKVGHSTRMAGKMRYDSHKNPSFIITLSDAVEKEKSDYEDTLIHEMIHVWIEYGHIRDNAPHGTMFTDEMKRINRLYNRNITVTDACLRNPKRKMNPSIPSILIMIFSYLSTGSIYAMQVSEKDSKYILDNMIGFLKSSGIDKIITLYSHDSFAYELNKWSRRYGHIRACKIQPEELKRIVDTGVDKKEYPILE